MLFCFAGSCGSTFGAAPLQWEEGNGFRRARLTVPASGHAGFTLLTPQQTGILFTNELSYPRSLTNQNLLNGAGVAAGDFDGDGWPDLYFCNLEGRNALFKNLGGWKFRDVTASAGVGAEHLVSRGAAFADVNGDGRLDLLVTSLFGPNALYLNEGNGHFKDVTQEAGLVVGRVGCESMALGDVDGNGWLDLYIANNGDNSVLRSGGSISVRKVNGKDQVVGRSAQRLKIIGGQLVEYGPPHVLFLNDGLGHFKAVSWTDGSFLNDAGQPLSDAPRDLGLAVSFRDINGDGAPDIYVCNDFLTPDRIWINNGSGRFRALPDRAIRTTCHFSMCVDFADIDRDGHDEIFVNDMLSRIHRLRMTQLSQTNPAPELVGETMDRQQARRNTLQWNRGDNTFAEIGQFAGVDASDWTWSVAFLDVDLDGYEDLLTVNGHAYDTLDLDVNEREAASGESAAMAGRRGKSLKDYPPLATPNYAFHNRRDRTFTETGHQWGFDSTNVSHGIALTDLDNDGDLDVAVSCLWTPPLLYRNESSAPRLAVRLRGRPGNTQGIGAKITVRGGAVPVQSQEMQCGSRYLSSDQPTRVFAAGSSSNRLEIEVRWRSGLVSLLRKVEANCVYEIDENSALPAPPSSPAAPALLFQDVSDRLAHRHDELPFDEIARQPLLHRLLSRLGPGVAWYDCDGDGHEDLIIGAGRGGALGVYRSDGRGGFTAWNAPGWKAVAPDDYAGLAGWTPAPGQSAILAALSRYESDPATTPALLRWDASKPGAPAQPVPSAGTNLFPGPVAVADVDGDAALDVFVGGRVLPGKYPLSSPSVLFRNRGGALEVDSRNAQALAQLGMVSGAVWTDLDGDGDQDLVAVCEWGPLQVLRNDRGQLVPWQLGLRVAPGHERFASTLDGVAKLSQLTGWWNGVAAGDLDGDGSLDLVVSNWGLNSPFGQPTFRQPAIAYAGDFDGNGVFEWVQCESKPDPQTGQLLPRRDMAFLATGWPELRGRFASHRLFSEATMAGILGPVRQAQGGPQSAQTNNVTEVQAVCLASVALFNRGDHFLVAPLPFEAQVAPAFGVCVADLDGDGYEDVFLSQNCFAVPLTEFRLDAGRGLWLRGAPEGRLTAVPGQESGLIAYGDQRGAALADFDEDGRVDLVFAQNNSETKLFRNAAARPGLRVRLQGPPGNPLAIGAGLRLMFGEKAGPLRELHAGSGYWSQDSAVAVLATPATPTQIWVRWPGGKITRSNIPTGAKTIVVDPTGAVRPGD